MNTLDIITRYELAEKIAKQWTDNADLKEIESYFFNSQFEYLNDLPDDELLSVAQDQGVQLWTDLNLKFNTLRYATGG